MAITLKFQEDSLKK